MISWLLHVLFHQSSGTKNIDFEFFFYMLSYMYIAPATDNDISILAVLHLEGWHSAYAGAVDQGFFGQLIGT